MFGPGRRMEKFWKLREQAWRGLCRGEQGVGGVELQPPKFGGGSGKAGEAGKKGCCLWVNAMGDLAQTQQLD